MLAVQLLGRQFLIFPYHASILRNLVGVTLIRAGPRVWILLNALHFYAIDVCTKHLRSKNESRSSTHLALVSRPFLSSAHRDGCCESLEPSQQSQHGHFENDNMNATEESHSELGEAFAFVRNVCKLFRSDQVISSFPAAQLFKCRRGQVLQYRCL